MCADEGIVSNDRIDSLTGVELSLSRASQDELDRLSMHVFDSSHLGQLPEDTDCLWVFQHRDDGFEG